MPRWSVAIVGPATSARVQGGIPDDAEDEELYPKAVKRGGVDWMPALGRGHEPRPSLASVSTGPLALACAFRPGCFDRRSSLLRGLLNLGLAHKRVVMKCNFALAVRASASVERALGA